MSNDKDWYAIREAYINGATWQELMDTYNISKGAIHKHKTKEHWDDLKRQRQLELAKRIKNNHIKRTVKDIVEFNYTCEDGADQAARITRNAIIRIARDHDNQAMKLDAKYLKELLGCLRESLDIKRLINNIVPTRHKEDEIVDEVAVDFALLNGDTPEIVDLMNELTRRLENVSE